jgi:hypothetical protein
MPAIKLKLNNETSYWNSLPAIGYGARAFSYAERKPTTFSIIDSEDSTTYLFNATLDLTAPIYSLFITGVAPVVDTVFRAETNYPYVSQSFIPPREDSIVYIRFANLSPNSMPINIRLKDAPTNEVSNLAYKAITDFKSYPADSSVHHYNFEIRDAIADTLLLKYSFNVTDTNRFKNVALILKGLQGGTNGDAFSVSEVNYFQ